MFNYWWVALTSLHQIELRWWYFAILFTVWSKIVNDGGRFPQRYTLPECSPVLLSLNFKSYLINKFCDNKLEIQIFL